MWNQKQLSQPQLSYYCLSLTQTTIRSQLSVHMFILSLPILLWLPMCWRRLPFVLNTFPQETHLYALATSLALRCASSEYGYSSLIYFQSICDRYCIWFLLWSYNNFPQITPTHLFGRSSEPSVWVFWMWMTQLQLLPSSSSCVLSGKSCFQNFTINFARPHSTLEPHSCAPWSHVPSSSTLS